MSTATVPAEIEQWCASEFSVRPGSFVREFAGGSRPLWYAASAEHGPVVVRLEPPGAALSGSDYGMQREVDVYRALEGSSVPVPRLVGHGRLGAGEAIVMTRAPGSSRVSGAAARSSASMVDSFMSALAALHREGAERVATFDWGRPASIAEATDAEVRRWRQLAAGVSPRPGDDDDLLVLCALAWLATALPDLPGADGRATLVQGDTGPGNAVFDDGAVSALVDWELAHLGDPAEDIAWVDQRSASLPDPFGDLHRRRAAHAVASSGIVAEERVAVHAVFVRARCAIITGRTVAAGGGSLGRAVYEPARHRFRVELADMLLSAVGGDPALAEPGGDDPHIDVASWFADPPAPAGDDPADRLAAREAAVAQAHVRAVTDVGEALAESDRRDRTATMGPDDGDSLVSIAESAGRAGDIAVIGHLARSARRAAVLWPDPPIRR
jgi:aminoglycoside phosphotransferase (APT) family kinase protein